MALIVYILDDDPSVRDAYARLLASARIETHTFASANLLMQADIRRHNACVLSDIRLAATSALDLPQEFNAAGRPIPVIFVTSHDTPAARAEARQAGAAACFLKPVDGQALLDAISWATQQPASASVL